MSRRSLGVLSRAYRISGIICHRRVARGYSQLYRCSWHSRTSESSSPSCPITSIATVRNAVHLLLGYHLYNVCSQQQWDRLDPGINGHSVATALLTCSHSAQGRRSATLMMPMGDLKFAYNKNNDGHFADAGEIITLVSTSTGLINPSLFVTTKMVLSPCSEG